MELRHLRYYVALAERLNFTLAAEQVHITQSTLSHQIRQLEDELGVRLFDRSGKRVSLTHEGHIFLGSVTRALREIDNGIITLKDESHEVSGALTIGAIHTFNISLTPGCIATFVQKNPGVQVRVEELPAPVIEQRLVDEDLDVAIGYPARNTAELRYEPLMNDELVLAVSTDHPLSARKKIRMVELHRQRLVLLQKDSATRQLVDGCFLSAGAEPMVIAECNTSAAMLDLALRLNVGTIVSEHAATGAVGMHTVQLESPKPVRTPSVLWKRDRTHSSAAKSFVEIVKRMVRTSRPVSIHRARPHAHRQNK